MTMPQVEYGYYTDTYKGGLSEADFGAALGHAVAAVKDLIAYNVPTGDAQVDAYRMAVCTACDVDAAYGFSGGVMEQVASAGIGSFSYSTPQGTADSEPMYWIDINRAIRQQLVGTGLLDRVIC